MSEIDYKTAIFQFFSYEIICNPDCVIIYTLILEDFFTFVKVIHYTEKWYKNDCVRSMKHRRL